MNAPGSLALDTSVVVRHLRTGPQAIAAQMASATELYLPLTVLGELRYGVKRSGNDRRAVEQMERLAQEVIILYPDDATADAYALLKNFLAAKARPIPDNDLWIAATALSHDLPLFCRDAHFDELASEMTIIQAPLD